MTAEEARKLTDENIIRLPMCDTIDKLIITTCKAGKCRLELRVDRGSIGENWDVARLAQYYGKQGFKWTYSIYTFTLSW